MILIDSDVLIWLTRGHVGAKTRLMQINPWRISTITYLELAQGCRSKEELQRAKRGLAVQQTQVLPLTPAISERAMALIDAHALADGLQLADALIAATALEHGLMLLTGNTKHFAAVEALKVERFEP
ncbi:MAG TPA: type II toxin-antitoxin system VapC family toxin [Acidiferrobacterales bacterium]|nr:type II toxin-antitoxin system VapC family toxin [Acidiferrobacterales bacterium]